MCYISKTKKKQKQNKLFYFNYAAVQSYEIHSSIKNNTPPLLYHSNQCGIYILIQFTIKLVGSVMVCFVCLSMTLSGLFNGSGRFGVLLVYDTRGRAHNRILPRGSDINCITDLPYLDSCYVVSVSAQLESMGFKVILQVASQHAVESLRKGRRFTPVLGVSV